MWTQSRARRMALCAVLTALALGLALLDNYISSAISFMPGIKLGIANIVTLFSLYTLTKKETLAIIAARCFLAALLSGNISMLPFSLCGALLSFAVMALLQNKISMVKVSLSGALSHNAAQIIIAIIVTESPRAVYYLPYMLIAGAVSGFFMGILCGLLLQRAGKPGA